MTPEQATATIELLTLISANLAVGVSVLCALTGAVVFAVVNSALKI